jgi:hypothetical protein
MKHCLNSTLFLSVSNTEDYPPNTVFTEICFKWIHADSREVKFGKKL